MAKQGLDVQPLNDLMTTPLAAIWVKICNKGRKVLTVGAIYREHQLIIQDSQEDSGSDSKQQERWAYFVNSWLKAARGNKNVIVIGDTNLDFKKWALPDPPKTNMVDRVKSDIETLGFFQMVTDITRSWPGQPDSLIDQIWMNSPGKLLSHKNLPRTFSDHNLLIAFLKLKMESGDRHDILRRDRKNFNVDKYKEQIEKIDWDPLLASNNIDVINDIFITNILEVLDKMAPLKKYQKRKKMINWLSPELKLKMEERDRLRDVARMTGAPEDWASYRVSRNRCVKDLSKCKKSHFNKIYEQMEDTHDSRGLYRLTNELLDSNSVTTPQQFLDGGNLVRKPCDMANLQINYYVDKLKKLVQNIPVSQRNPHRFLDRALNLWEEKDARVVFMFREVTKEETLGFISSLSNSTAFGNDNLDSLGIKQGGISLITPIRHIINTSLIGGKVAMKWKLAALNPRLKASDLDRQSVSSYRPIAVLPSVSKLVERAAQNQLQKYFEDSGQINPSSHAYQKYLSTTTTLEEITDELYQAVEAKKIVSIMQIDQSAAFDVVSHKLLMEKLQRYNVGIEACNWIQEYLTQRTQYVVIGSKKSRMVPVISGVPQGSVIGPLLFLIYSNEMTEVIKNSSCLNIAHQDRRTLWGKQCSDCGIITQYADDTTFTIGNLKRQDNLTKLRRNLEEITLYLQDNKLSINQTKTSLMEAMIPQKRGKTQGFPPTLRVQTDTGNIKIVEDSHYIRVLGGNLQRNLAWQAHLETGSKPLLPRIRKLIGRLKHLGNLIPMRNRKNLGKGLIVSQLNYLQPLWGGSSQHYLNRAQIVLNIIARWMTGMGKGTRIMELMTAADLLTVREQIKVSTAVQVWKIVHLSKPQRLRDRMPVVEDLKIELQRPRLLLTRDCFRWRGTEIWNNLESEMRQEKSLSKFKKMMKRLVLDERQVDPLVPG